MWWPEKKVRRMVIWKARQMQPSDYKQRTAIGGNGNSTGTWDTFTPKPYLCISMNICRIERDSTLLRTVQG